MTGLAKALSDRISAALPGVDVRVEPFGDSTVFAWGTPGQRMWFVIASEMVDGEKWTLEDRFQLPLPDGFADGFITNYRERRPK